MRALNLKNLIWKENNIYVAQCLNFDVASFGKTRKQALINLEDAINLYLDGHESPTSSYVKVTVPEVVESKLTYA